MPVDVVTEIVIDRRREVVAEYAADPSNAPPFYAKIRSSEWLTAPPLGVGTQLAFEARFLGRTLAYTYKVVSYAPAEHLTMRTAQGPFPMETTYTWSTVDSDRTRMTLRNRGEPQGFSKLVAPLMAGAVRRANRHDLALLKQILESAGAT